jgi:hypothetical protein
MKEITAPLMLLLEDNNWSEETTLTEICPEGSTGDSHETSVEDRVWAVTLFCPKPLSKTQKESAPWR